MSTTTGLPNLIVGPNRTSPSSQAFTVDPSMGPGYVPPSNPVKSIATVGPPVSTLDNPEAMQYTNSTSGTIYSVYTNEQSGSCPSLLGAAFSGNSVYEPLWVGASLTTTNNGGFGINWGGPSAPSPAPNSNQTEGETGTEQFLQTKMDVDAPQQGSNAIAGSVQASSLAGVNPANIQVFKWD